MTEGKTLGCIYVHGSFFRLYKLQSVALIYGYRSVSSGSRVLSRARPASWSRSTAQRWISVIGVSLRST